MTTDRDAPRKIASSRMFGMATFGYENHTGFAYGLRWAFAFCATLSCVFMMVMMFVGLARQLNPLQLWPMTLAITIATAAGVMSGLTHSIFRLAKRRRMLEKAGEV